MDKQLKLPPLRLCGQAFLFAWRMGLFFSAVIVLQAPDPYGFLAGGRLAFLLAFAAGSVGVFLGSRTVPGRLTDKSVVWLGTVDAILGVLLVLASTRGFPGAFAVCIGGFAIAGLGDACLSLAFGKMYGSLSVRLSMRAVPVAMALGAVIYALMVNNAVAIALPVLVLLPLACGMVLLHDLAYRQAQGSDQSLKPLVSQVEEPARSRFTKWKIASYTSVLWLTFGLMWPLAASRLFAGPSFLMFSLSVAALIVIVSVVLAVLTYVLRLPAVKTFWIFVPLTFAGITVVAVIDSNLQVLAFAMVFAAHNIAEVQLITHFAAICRRRGYSSRMLYGCGFAILGVAEALGLLAGMAIVPAQSSTLTVLLLVCANAIVIAVILSIMRVNTRFQKAELEMALAKLEQAQRDAAAVGSDDGQAGAASSADGARANDTPAATAARWVGQYGLSARESEVAELLLSGRNVPAVAELLCISPSTVQTHVKHIYEKVGVRTRQELIAKGSESVE